MIVLSVPYSEKDQAAKLGARWSKERRTWYVPPGMLLSPFECWLPSSRSAAEMLKAAKRPKARIDSITGKITIGKDYKPAIGAVGLPWTV